MDLPVEVVGLNVGGDGRWEKIWAGVSAVEAATEFGGGDVLVDCGEQVDAGPLGGGESERRQLRQIEEGRGERG